MNAQQLISSELVTNTSASDRNAKYRSYLKKTIEFDPDIMKRYVNFMSNPDERTAIDQFGTGDKYFGVRSERQVPQLPQKDHRIRSRHHEALRELHVESR